MTRFQRPELPNRPTSTDNDESLPDYDTEAFVETGGLDEGWGFEDDGEYVDADDPFTTVQEIVEDDSFADYMTADDGDEDDLDDDPFADEDDPFASEYKPLPEEIRDFTPDEEVEDGFAVETQGTFASIISAIKADLAGHADQKDQKNDKLATPEPKRKKSTKKAKNKSKSNLLKTLGKPYNALVNMVFSVLSGVLKILTMIPVVGRVFKPIRSNLGVLKAVARFLPILLILGLFIIPLYLSLPDSQLSMELPDEGLVEAKLVSYENNTASVEIVNSGYTLLQNAGVDVSIYSWNPGLNPLTWVRMKNVATCSSEPTAVDIDSSTTVQVPCESTGWFPQASLSVYADE